MKTFLALTVIALSMLGCATTGSNSATGPKKPVGIQLYSLRAQFAKDVPGTLDKVRSFGFEYVELAGTYGMPPEKFKAELDARKLKAVAGHFPYERIRDKTAEVAMEAKALGLEYVGCAWIPHNGPFDEKGCRDAIAVFNKVGEQLAKENLKFFYHIHGYEFAPYGDGTLFDLMMRETNPKFVNYEMDVFWAVHAGQDCVKLFEKYPGRWPLTHLKDMKESTPTGLLTGGSDVSNNVPLGTGKIPFPAIFQACAKEVKWHFIEDESPTVEQQIPQSLNYLKSLK